MFGVLSKSFEGDYKGMIDLRMDEVLIVDVVYLLGFHDLVFVEQFEGNVLSCLFVFGHFYFPEAT
jgi:hypothetical protein